MSAQHLKGWRISGAAIALLAIGCATTPTTTKPTIDSVQHIIVIYAENRSFDHLYGLFPGANGIANATPEQYIQVDRDGTTLAHLPPVWKGKNADPAYPDSLPNKPFRLDLPPVNMPLTVATRDTIHKFYPQQEQINGGRNDRFVEVSDSGALPMGYYDGSSLPMWKLAQEFVLADNFFMGAFGDSFLNHFWLVCACMPFDPNAPIELRAKLDNRGRLQRTSDSPWSALAGPTTFTAGEFTPEGFALSTNQPPWQPSRVPPAKNGDPRAVDPTKHHLPPQTGKTIGDTLTAKGISWAWYSGAWDVAVADGMQPPRPSGWSSTTTKRAPRTSSPTTSRSTISCASPRARPIARATSRITTSSSRGSIAATFRRSCSTSRRARSTSIPATPTSCPATSTPRHSSSGSGRARSGRRR
jgi:phospholipase C